jgi:cell wall-associated NlpC family hydrolase
MRSPLWVRNAGCCIFCIVLFTGCLTSTVRYGRPRVSGTGQGTGSTVVINGGPVEPSKLKKILDSYLGTPYRYGGMSRDGIDCSGLACVVFRELDGTVLPRSAAAMVNLGEPVHLAEVRAGDLIFFRWGMFGSVDHVGIGIGEGRFVHASSSHGVIESGLADEYYRTHFITARRVFK